MYILQNFTKKSEESNDKVKEIIEERKKLF